MSGCGEWGACEEIDTLGEETVTLRLKNHLLVMVFRYLIG
jgi:hypothetical protein